MFLLKYLSRILEGKPLRSKWNIVAKFIKVVQPMEELDEILLIVCW